MKYEVLEISQQSWQFVVSPALAPQLEAFKNAINKDWKPANKAEAEMIDKALTWEYSDIAKVLAMVKAQKWPSWDGRRETRFSEKQAKAVIIGWSLKLKKEISQSEHIYFLLDAMESGTEAYIEFARVAYVSTTKERQID